MTVIPDSIEPYRGYKALNVLDDGLLCSPSYAAIWPVKRAFEATCGATQEWGWVPVEGEPRSMDDTVTIARHLLRGVLFATASSSVSSMRAPTPRSKPNNPLPPGWSWSWEMFTHAVPDENCECGVYVAKEPKECIHYMGRANGIIVEVALWGRVVPAHCGARGQYAYPKRILAPRALVSSVKKTALLYDAPILVLDPLESAHLCTDPGCECEETCRMTGMLRHPEAIVNITTDTVAAKSAFEGMIARLLAGQVTHAPLEDE